MDPRLSLPVASGVIEFLTCFNGAQEEFFLLQPVCLPDERSLKLYLKNRPEDQL